MGKLRNFKKIKWKPFQSRIDDICVTNYYINDKGRKCSLQSHLDYPKFSFFEIVKYEANPRFGKEDEYREAGYKDSFGGYYLTKENASIQKSMFLNAESRYMLANWENMDRDEKTPDLQFCGSRPLDLDAHEQFLFMQLAKEGQEHIQKVLNNFNEEEYD